MLVATRDGIAIYRRAQGLQCRKFRTSRVLGIATGEDFYVEPAESRRPFRAQLQDIAYLVLLRIFMYGLIAGGFGSMSTPESASAAKRRPPPQEEKKDPNVSGVQAKVLASKKRKEAMKETVSKLREKGKPVQ